MTSVPPLAGRLAVVAGASRGIGLAIAEELQGAGAHVVRLARSLRDAEAERRTDIACDVTDPQAVESVARRIVAARGAPDVLVNNAGAFLLKPLVETQPSEFRDQLTANLLAPFMVLRALLPSMVRRGRGLVITVGSIADHVPLPGNAAYGASKYGLRGLHEVLVAETAGTGVKCSLICPGPTDTELWDPVDPDTRPGFTARREMLRAEDVAEAVLFIVTRGEGIVVPELRIEPRR